MRLPEDVIARYADGSKSMAITGFDVEMVRKTSDGAETKVGLNDHYLHHYILSMGRTSTLEKILEHKAEDKMFARMLTSCHAMTGAPLHNFLTQLNSQPGGGRVVGSLGFSCFCLFFVFLGGGVGSL